MVIDPVNQNSIKETKTENSTTVNFLKKTYSVWLKISLLILTNLYSTCKAKMKRWIKALFKGVLSLQKKWVKALASSLQQLGSQMWCMFRSLAQDLPRAVGTLPPAHPPKKKKERKTKKPWCWVQEARHQRLYNIRSHGSVIYRRGKSRDREEVSGCEGLRRKMG